MAPLDNPAWHALSTLQSALSEGGDLARRYVPGVNLFAATPDDSPAALAELAALVAPGEQIYVMQARPVAVPDGLVAIMRAMGVQMVLAGPSAHLPDPRGEIVPLTDADVPEMLSLTALTQPGPFFAQTNRMGAFFGIRRNGRLAAMAGERMRFSGYSELSGVCSHPDFRGEGLARLLCAHVTARIEERGEIPFLHAWKTNEPAIRLYGTLGYRHRCDVHVAVLERPR